MSSAALRDAFLRRAEAARKDPMFGLPAWIREGGPAAMHGVPVFVCGSTQHLALRAAVKNYNVVGIVDDFRTGELHGVPYLSTQQWIEAARKEPRAKTIIAVESVLAFNHFTRIATEFELPYLDMLGYARVTAMDETPGFARPLLHPGIHTYRHTLENVEQLVAVERRFADEFSLITLFSLYLHRLTFDPNFPDRCGWPYQQAFRYGAYMLAKPIIDLGNDEVFLDGGAFRGETLEQFVRACNGEFRRVYSFEPDPEGFTIMEATVDRLANEYGEGIRPRLTLSRAGLWSHATKLRFDGSMLPASVSRSENHVDKYAAHIVESGFTDHLGLQRSSDDDFVIDTVSIDEACDEPVTLLKLEVEGSELAALNGAKQTMIRHRPKLAISVYHKPEDFLTLPVLVQETVPEYGPLILRHHNHRNANSTVFYARVNRS